jgi:8-oxo-dGTP diphosphatase
MTLPHRIAAGGIVLRNDTMLLVRYSAGNNGSFLVAPGGKVEQEENIEEAIIREVFEETGIRVRPNAVVLIEDLVFSAYKMCKIWMTCRIEGGEIRRTPEAVKEGIVEAGWYTRESLESETVFPPLILEREWSALDGSGKEIVIPKSKRAFL